MVMINGTISGIYAELEGKGISFTNFLSLICVAVNTEKVV